MPTPKYLITGTGRCGTLFVANLLTSMGFPCSHEAIFTPMGIEWAREVMDGKRPCENSRISEGKRCIPEDPNSEFVAESSYMAAPFLKELDTQVIHVVRNPLDVVASLVGDGFKQFSSKTPTNFEDDPAHFEYEKFMYEHVPELGGDMTQLERGCMFYVRWNEMIEKSGKVSLFHRIEDETDRVRDFLRFSGETYYENRRCNSVESRRKWELSEIRNTRIKEQIFEMSRRYGYDIGVRKIF